MGFKAPEESQFKGYPVLKIVVGKKFQSEEEDVLILGVKKAAAVCEHIDAIRMFCDKHEKKGRG